CPVCAPPPVEPDASPLHAFVGAVRLRRRPATVDVACSRSTGSTGEPLILALCGSGSGRLLRGARRPDGGHPAAIRRGSDEPPTGDNAERSVRGAPPYFRSGLRG